MAPKKEDEKKVDIPETAHEQVMSGEHEPKHEGLPPMPTLDERMQDPKHPRMAGATSSGVGSSEQLAGKGKAAKGGKQTPEEIRAAAEDIERQNATLANPVFRGNIIYVEPYGAPPYRPFGAPFGGLMRGSSAGPGQPLDIYSDYDSDTLSTVCPTCRAALNSFCIYFEPHGAGTVYGPPHAERVAFAHNTLIEEARVEALKSQMKQLDKAKENLQKMVDDAQQKADKAKEKQQKIAEKQVDYTQFKRAAEAIRVRSIS